MNEHLFQTRIALSHLDSFGHVNNAAYFTLLEEARWEQITRAGFGRKKIAEMGIGPTILEASITFRRELLLGDEIQIKSNIFPPERKIFRIQQRIDRAEQLCSEAEFLMAMFDLKERKIVTPPAEWIRALGLH